jgi:hypothetical protein
VTFVACRPGAGGAALQPEGRSGSYADGAAVTFWSGFVLTRAPACIPLDIYVDDAPSLRRVGLPLGRRWVRLAGRSREGARSERAVRRALESLDVEGWRLLHSVPWPGGGDTDHVAIAPRDAGVAFAIEAKTSAYRPEHVARTATTAHWLVSRRWSAAAGGATHNRFAMPSERLIEPARRLLRTSGASEG